MVWYAIPQRNNRWDKRRKQIVCTSKWSSVVKNMITVVREMTLHKIPIGKIYGTFNNIIHCN